MQYGGRSALESSVHPKLPDASDLHDLAKFSKVLQELNVEHERLLVSLRLRCERQRLLEEEVARLRLHPQGVSTNVPSGSCNSVNEWSRSEEVDFVGAGKECVAGVGRELVTGAIIGKQNGRTISFVGGINHRSTSGASDSPVNQHSNCTILDQFSMILGYKHSRVRVITWSNQLDSFKKLDKNMLMHRFVRSQAFDLFCVSAIILNALMLGVGAEYSARRQPLNPFNLPKWYKDMDAAFTVWFVLELLMRIASSGRSFLTGEDWSWNWFDLTVVTLDVLEKAILASFSDFDSSFSNFTAVRILRVLRITRAVRLVKLVRVFRELRMMVYSILKSAPSLCWSMLIIIMIIYVFCLFVVQNVSDYLFNEGPDVLNYEKLRDHWGSLSNGHYTLYQVMTGGISWGEVSNPLISIHWTNGLVIAFFVFFTVIVVSNIITGIFVEVAIQSAQSDREEVISEELHSKKSTCSQLKTIFEDADTDGSGTITIEEFECHLRDRRVRAHLASLGLEVDKAQGLFRLLDMDDSGSIGLEEFVIGCMRLKGGAKSIDLVTLMYENKRLLAQFRALIDTIKGQLPTEAAHLEGIPRQRSSGHWVFREKAPRVGVPGPKNPESLTVAAAAATSLAADGENVVERPRGASHRL